MSTRILYGVPTETLEEVLNLYLVQQGNSRRSHFADYMITAQEVWEQLFRGTIWQVRQVIADVDQDKHTLQLPRDMERFLSISVMDHCGDLQPLTYDPNMNTLEVLCHKKTCSCTECNGEGSMCDAIDSLTMREAPVVIDTITYYERIWNRKCGHSIMEVRETPAKDGDEITWVTSEKLICDVDVDEKGCIKPTEPNRQLFDHHFGLFLLDCHRRLCDDHHLRCRTQIPPNFSYYGFYKPDATCDGIIHLKHVKADKVIVSYQPAAGITDGQVMVPKYAKDAMMYGLFYYSVRFRTNVSIGERREAENNFKMAVRKLFLFMFPISLEEFTKLPSRRRIW